MIGEGGGRLLRASFQLEDTTTAGDSPVRLRFPHLVICTYTAPDSTVSTISHPLLELKLFPVTQTDTTTHRTPPMAGTLSLLLGFGLAVMVLTVRLNANWGIFNRVVARNPVMCFGIAVSLIAAGVVLIKQHSSTGDSWRPRLSGRRFREAILYTRSDCPLCDEAVLTLSAYEDVLPPIETVDVDSDPDFKDEFGNCVPVLALDGRVRFRGHISEPLLRRLIEGTPPA